MHKSYWVDFTEIWFKDGKKGHEKTKKKKNIFGANLLTSDVRIIEIGQIILQNKRKYKNKQKMGLSGYYKILKSLVFAVVC